MPCKCGCY